MQALMNFKENLNETIVGNEDMQEEIKDMLKNFHGNLLMLQQVVEVKENEDMNSFDRMFLVDRSMNLCKRRAKSIKWILMNSIHSSRVYWNPSFVMH